MLKNLTGALLAALTLVLGVVIPLSLHPTPEVLTILWTVSGILILTIGALYAPPVRRLLARLGSDTGEIPATPGVYIQNLQGGATFYAPGQPGNAPAERAASGHPRRFRDETVRLADLVAGIDPPVLAGYDFEGCVIEGPVVVALMRGPGSAITITGCDFGVRSIGDLVIEVPARTLIGVIGLDYCAFRNCRFRGVGIAGPPEVISMIEGGTAIAPPT